ncbi:MAG TPA: serine/threonine-protein kinase, partial [Chroococcales cyanobacterium]
WASQIAEVLNFLHSNDPKVIYRDLKPSNIMIDTKDRVKLVDFGIARPYEETDNTHVVSAGYSPPEQYWGGADPRSDIYALGATMFFLLTGQEPLALQTSYPRKINPEVSERTDLIVQRATQQDVWMRYQTAPEMKNDLDWTPKEPVPRFRIVETALVVVVAIAVAAFGTFFALKMGALKKETASKGIDTSKLTDAELKKRDEEIKKLKAEKEKETKLLQSYMKEKKNAEATENTASVSKPMLESSQQTIASIKEGFTTKEKETPGVAFKETDEAQLTDPEGLAPLEEDSQGRAFKIPFFGNPAGNSSQN